LILIIIFITIIITTTTTAHKFLKLFLCSRQFPLNIVEKNARGGSAFIHATKQREDEVKKKKNSPGFSASNVAYTKKLASQIRRPVRFQRI
jgi:hypothetical protein